MTHPGLGWDAFQKHRKAGRRRRAILWIISSISVLIGSLLFSINFFQSAPTKSSYQPREEQANLLVEQNHHGMGLYLDQAETDSGGQILSSEFEQSPESTLILPIQDPIKNPHANLPLSNIAEDPTEEPLGISYSNLFRVPFIALSGIPYSIHLNEPDQVLSEFELPSIKTTTNKTKSSLWFVQLQAGPQYALHNFNVRPEGLDYVHKNYEDIRKAGEVGLAGFGFHIGIGRTLGSFNIRSGLGFVSQSIAAKYHFQNSESPVIDVDNRIIDYMNHSPIQFNLEDFHRYQFIEVPLVLECTAWKRNNLSAGPVIGHTSQFLLGVTGSVPNSIRLTEVDQLRISNFNYYTSTIDLGMNFTLNLKSNRQLLFHPSYRFNTGLNQIQGYYNNRLSSFGIQCILRTAL
jgi:hypothetical protein